MATYSNSAVLSKAFDTIGTRPSIFLLMPLLLTGIPGFMIDWWTAQFITDGDPQGLRILWQSSEFWPPAILVVLISWAASAVLQGALTDATVKTLHGETPGFAQSLDTGLIRCLPLMAIGPLLALGVTLGLILLIVPGVILWLCWSVTVPACVVERTGVFASFERSWELTSGVRGNLFLLAAAVGIGLWIFNFLLNYIAAMMMSESPVVLALVQAFTSCVSAVVMETLWASVYVALVDAKEGSRESELEQVFS